MAGRHTTSVGRSHDLCRGEIVEARAVPILGTGRSLSEADRIPGVVDPHDELT